MKSKSLVGILILVFFLPFSSCHEDDETKVIPPKEVENKELKATLQGDWYRTFDWESNSLFQLTFDGYKVYWRDSTVNIYENQTGEIQTVTGNCPVKYTFNDGVNYYNPLHSSLYWFNGTTENNILWVFVSEAKSTIRDYKLTNGIVTFEKEWKADALSPYLTSSYVVFHDNKTKAEFCEPVLGGFTCLTYTRD